MTVAAFVILGAALFFTWTDPDGLAKVPHFGSGTVRARIIVVALSWLFVAGATWMLIGEPDHLAGWFVVLMSGAWFVPSLWVAERAAAAGEILVGLWMGPVVICCASVIGGVRLASAAWDELATKAKEDTTLP